MQLTPATTQSRQLAILAMTWVMVTMSAHLPSAIGQSVEQNSEKPPASEAGLSVEELQQRLDGLEAGSAKQRAATAATSERNAVEIKELEARRKSLANHLLQSQLEVEANSAKLNALRESAKQSAAQAESLTGAVNSIPSAVIPAIEQLLIHLREVPGSAASVERLRTAAKELARIDTNTATASVAALNGALAEINEAHAQAHRISVGTAEIYTAGGQLETIKLLSLGHVRFAYECSDGRVGLALSSSRDATGYRWSEQVSAEVAGWIRECIVAVERPQGKIINFPLDPTGRIQAGSLVAEPTLVERFGRGGMVMWPLAGVALMALTLIATRAWLFYIGNRGGNRIAAGVIAASRDNDFATAIQRCDVKRGAVGRVLAACLARRTQGQRAMEDSIQEQLLQELPRMQRFMGGIATLAAVAPLLGLLGTVTGIIRTFGVIRAFGNANPSLMAGGISEALLTTAAGLVIAVPILIIHSVLRGRSDRIVADAERHAAMLLTELTHSPQANPTENVNAASPMTTGASGD